MRAQFVRHQENPLDTLDIGRIKERKFKKLFAEIKNEKIIPFMKKNKLDINTISDFYYVEEKNGFENIGITFMGTINMKECEYVIGYSEGGDRGYKSFLSGYNLGDGNWIWGKNIDKKNPGSLHIEEY